MDKSKLGVCVLAVCFFATGCVYGYSGGDGTVGAPFQISTDDDLLELAADPNNYDKHFIMTNSIRFYSSILRPPIAPMSEESDDPNFSGVFDGGGHAIRDLAIGSHGSGTHLGLFGEIGSNGIVRNLMLEDVSVGGGPYIGALCGANYGTISNCGVIGEVRSDGNFIGGLCGFNAGKIQRGFADCDIYKGDYFDYIMTVGGLCGTNFYGHIEDCYARGRIDADVLFQCGGLCGTTFFGRIDRCFAAVYLNVDQYDMIGGLCGENGCDAVNECYWDFVASGINYSAGGIASDWYSMTQASTYVGWNNGAWVIDEHVDYPHLAWEGTDGEVITTDYAARTYPGNGVDQPFEIDSPMDLLSMASRLPDWDKNFVLTSDVDMHDLPFMQPGIFSYTPPTDFTGNFDGQGFAIENLVINVSGSGNVSTLGLFGRVGKDSEIKNLSVIDIDFTVGKGSLAVGGVCGSNHGTITDCYASGNIVPDIYGIHFGILCGNNAGLIANCSSSGYAYGSWGIGGLCGVNHFGGIIENSQSDADITGNVVGGFCGVNREAFIYKCRSVGEVNNWEHTEGEIGGFCGFNMFGEFADCYSRGDVGRGEYSGEDIIRMGGFVGNNSGGRISNCYSTGRGDDYSPGGFCGYDDSLHESIFEDCYWDIQTSGTEESDRGTGLSTAEMYNLDFLDGWITRRGFDYPILGWEETLSGDVVGDFSVNLMDFYYLSNAWLTSPGHVNYIAEMNLDHTDASAGLIDVADLAVFCQNWLKDR